MAADSTSTKNAWKAAPIVTLLYAAVLLFQPLTVSASIFCVLSLGFAVGIALSLIIAEKATKVFLAVAVAVASSYGLSVLFSILATGDAPFPKDSCPKCTGIGKIFLELKIFLCWAAWISFATVLFSYVAGLGRQFGYWLQEHAHRAARESTSASVVPIVAAVISAAASVVSALLGGK